MEVEERGVEFVVVNEIKKVSSGWDQSQIFIQEKTDNMQMTTGISVVRFQSPSEESEIFL